MKASWAPEHCEPHSIFVSQGDYPLKGLHYLPESIARDPQEIPRCAGVWMAGNDLTAYHTLKQKLKISAYGQYLRDLIREGQLEDCVHFTGKLTEQQMRERFLRSHLFLCCFFSGKFAELPGRSHAIGSALCQHGGGRDPQSVRRRKGRPVV